MFHASSLLALLVAGAGVWSYVVIGVVVAITVALLLAYGGARVEVTEDDFVAGRARVPLRFLARPEALDVGSTRERIGPSADARAYLLLRPYVARSVVVELTDPRDPTPYWLVSTRHPQRLAATLAEKTARRAPGPDAASESAPGSAAARTTPRSVSSDPHRAD